MGLTKTQNGVGPKSPVNTGHKFATFVPLTKDSYHFGALALRGLLWYASRMPAVLPRQELEAAAAAVAYAQQVRAFHRRRANKRSPQREADIALALQRLREAMAPLRSEIGRFPYGPQTTEAEGNRDKIREASEAIQRERRKLWKMKKP